jgi:hypothetical protein
MRIEQDDGVGAGSFDPLSNTLEPRYEIGVSAVACLNAKFFGLKQPGVVRYDGGPNYFSF